MPDLDLLVLTWLALCIAGIAAVVAMLWMTGRPCPMAARRAEPSPAKSEQLDRKLRRATSAVAVLFAASLLAAR